MSERNSGVVKKEDFEKVVSAAVPEFTRLPRRAFLGRLVWGGLGVLGYSVNGSILSVSEVEENAREEKEAKAFGDVDQKELSEARSFEKQAVGWSEGKNLETLSQGRDVEQLERYFETIARENERKKLFERVWNTGDYLWLGLSGFMNLLGLNNLRETYKVIKNEPKALAEEEASSRKRFTRLVLNVRPEWSEKPPTKKELEDFCRGLSYLPPVGGKIIDSRSSGYEVTSKFKPSFMAEKQVDYVIKERRRKKRGRMYVHQMTVQGKMPDNFKYVAVGLILSSPYENDWTEPFFSAPWGNVAPLVHDGGVVNKTYSPVWKKVAGRTDFLQRISYVFEPRLEDLEGLPISEVAKIPEERLERAMIERFERERLMLEARAYQRLALALHASESTAPKSIPKKVRKELAFEWQLFISKMDQTLNENNIFGSVTVNWFSSKPFENSQLHGYGERHEAEWGPIQAELSHLEEVVKDNPELIRKARDILKESADRIDRAIGILPRES